MRAEGPLTDLTTRVLAKAASGLWLRQQAINANLANSQTPGYQPLQVDFEQALHAALSRDRTRFICQGPSAQAAVEKVTPRVKIEPGARRRWDGNAVNVEHEIVALAETTLQHEAVLRLLAHKLRMVEIAINGRAQ
ncbi:MAG: flagellar basal body rod protein FlgB [Armatimonadetes bacterium]|nr:flagellar basal body rod protein FlgB [Armatimonadota bacterium]